MGLKEEKGVIKLLKRQKICIPAIHHVYERQRGTARPRIAIECEKQREKKRIEEMGKRRHATKNVDKNTKC